MRIINRESSLNKEKDQGKHSLQQCALAEIFRSSSKFILNGCKYLKGIDEEICYLE